MRKPTNLKFCENCVFVTIRREIYWRTLWYLNQALNILYDRVTTKKMYTGHPLACHQFLEKWSVKQLIWVWKNGRGNYHYLHRHCQNSLR